MRTGISRREHVRRKPLPLCLVSALSRRGTRATFAFFLAPLFICSCQETQPLAPWSAAELVEELEALEQAKGDLSSVETNRRLRAFAWRAVHRPIEVTGADVVSLYQRGADWHTRPYFALTYERDSYVYLEEFDAGFQADLANHSFWASVAHTTGDRQLMFELALDQSTFERLRVPCRIEFTCELAAVIRGGRSVYCRALATTIVGCDDGTSSPDPTN